MFYSQVVGLTTSFLAQNGAKSALKSTCFSILFRVPSACAFVRQPWIVLGTLVVINNDEGDPFQLMYAQSTPFNAPLEWWSAHIAHARVGLQGSAMGPKVLCNASNLEGWAKAKRDPSDGGRLLMLGPPACSNSHMTATQLVFSLAFSPPSVRLSRHMCTAMYQPHQLPSSTCLPCPHPRNSMHRRNFFS